MGQQLAVRRIATILAVLGVTTLAGCASNTPIEDFPGVPLVPVAATGEERCRGRGEPEPELEEVEVPEGEPHAVYLDYGDRMAIVLWGSSTCPPVGSHIVVVEDQFNGNAVRLEVAEIPADQICTADLVPHTSVFGTPQSVTTTQPLRIDIDGEEIVLPVK